MKKVLMLIALFLFTFTPMSFAESTSTDRYQWIFLDDYVDYYFDTKTLKVENLNNGTLITVWEKEVLNQSAKDNFVLNPLHIPNVSYILRQEQLNSDDRSIKLLSLIYFDDNGYILRKARNSNPQYRPIVPDSNDERIYDSIFQYIQK